MKVTSSRIGELLVKLQLTVLLLTCSALGHSETVDLLQDRLSSFSHAKSLANSSTEVIAYEIGLGAIEKVRGQWKFKRSQRTNGLLQRDTWQIIDGFSSAEVLADLTAIVEADPQHEQLFSCDGRRCGQGVQWANRVFKERILYGREEMQRYRVYSLGSPATHWVLFYSGARSADRQYLHTELLELEQLGEAQPVEETQEPAS